MAEVSEQAAHDEGSEFRRGSTGYPPIDARRLLGPRRRTVCRIVRDRHVVSVPFEVVPGDLIVLREGHVIAADGVVRWAANVAIQYLPAAAQLFRVESPAGAHASAAIVTGVLAVVWRLFRKKA